ncbi:MAG TPA: N-acetylmuramic acid 6-phosphate etherase [Woeseiaceae bacterium]|nr:N-acetylmuramic acid 6-phosphate etherase [Woeseiaceae bacterium]
MSDESATEAPNPASADLDGLTPLAFVELVNREDAGIAAAVANAAPEIARAIERIAASLAAGGRLIYVGAGTSGRLGVLDAAEMPPTFGTPPGAVVGVIAGGSAALTRAVEGAEDSPEQGALDLQALAVSAADTVVGITASGTAPYVIGALEHAAAAGAGTIGFACNPGSPVAAMADIGITVATGPEVLAGSTRMKAGTATKMVLNMLSTGAMVRLGKTYGNLMVDLQATNRKLRARSLSIVARATGLGREAAAARLDEADGDVKVAIVCARLDVDPGTARRRLRDAGGRLRDALGESQP